MKLAWSHMVLYVEELEPMLDFYTRVLGFDITDRGAIPDGEREIVFLSQSPADHHQIAFITSRSECGPSNSVDHAAFRIGSLGELRELMASLKREGVVLRPRTHGNTWSVYFRDPEENGIEVFCDTPWHVRQPASVAWDPSLTDEALHEWTRRTFEHEETFSDIRDFYARRARELAGR